MKSDSRFISTAKEAFCNLSPFLSVGTILVIALAIIHALNLHTVEWQSYATSFQYNPKLLSTKLLPPRIRWGTSLFVYYVAFVGLMATSIAVIWRSLDSWKPWTRVLTIAGLGFVSLIVFSRISLKDTSVSIIIDLIQRHLGDYKGSILHAARNGAISVFFAVSAACTILFSPKQRDEELVAHMARQITELRVLLYIASLMLVASIFEIKFLFTCLTTCLLPEDSDDKLNLLLISQGDGALLKQLSYQTAIIKEIADATKSAAGWVFTAILTGMYLPTAFVLEGRMSALNEKLGIPATVAGGGASPVAIPQQPTKKEFIPHVVLQAMNVVATLSPLVLGTSLDFLGKLPI